MSERDQEWRTIGAKLKAAREYVGLSQDEAAVGVGLSRPAISLIENGRRKVDAVELARFSDLYQQSVEALTGRSSAEPLPENVQALARAASGLSVEDREQLLTFARFLQNKPSKSETDA